MKNRTNRINALGVVLLLLVMACSQKENKQQKEVSLREEAGFPVGAAISLKHVLGDPALVKLHARHFNSVTERSKMKMNRIMPQEGRYDWGPSDSLLAYSMENKQRLFGHCLIWHSSTPKWVVLKADGDSAWLDRFMQEYIATVVGRYKGKIHGWDVVNEGMETAGGEYRKTIWYNTLGEEYIAKAFRYAHAADPDAVLFYNDFNIERDTAKLHAVLRMIERLQEDGVPISGLGFQMHIRMDIPDETIAYALRKGAETGLQIHLSEVDIIFNTHNDERGGGVQLYEELTDSMRTAQAEKYRDLVRMYRTIVPEEQQYGITFWGFNDRDSWIRGFFDLMDWPCLFDEDLQPKPAFDGFLEGLRAAL